MNAEERKQHIKNLVELIASDVNVNPAVRLAFFALFEELSDLRNRVIKLENN